MTVLKRYTADDEWEIVGGITTPDPAPLAAHDADTTAVHGIADTAALALATDVSDAVGVVTDDLAVHGKGFVNHGATADTARPSGYGSVEWFGSVEPSNAVDGDSWVSTA